MNRKAIVLIVLILLMTAATSFYFAGRSEDAQIINHVVKLEKNLIMAQLHRISFEDFKDNTASFIHPILSPSYFEGIEGRYNGTIKADIAVSTLLPLYEKISKVYTSEDQKSKYVFVILSDERFLGHAAFQYHFIQDEGQWKIRTIKFYGLSEDMTKPENSAARFSVFNGETIEYKTVKILD